MCWVARGNLSIVRNWDQDVAIGSPEQQGKIKDKEKASDKHGKARNLSIKSSTKARSKLGHDGRRERKSELRKEYGGECRLMSETRQRMRRERGCEHKKVEKKTAW